MKKFIPSINQSEAKPISVMRCARLPRFALIGWLRLVSLMCTFPRFRLIASFPLVSQFPALATWAELLKAWLALTIGKQYQNQYVVKVLNAG